MCVWGLGGIYVYVCVYIIIIGNLSNDRSKASSKRRERRRKKLLGDLKDRRGYCQLKEEALDRTMWRNLIWLNPT